MQSLNDINKVQTVQQVPNQEGAGKPAPSRYNKFVNFVWILFFLPLIIIISYLVISDSIKTKKQVQANVDAVMNSPKMQEYRAKEARRQREVEKQRRLRELGIDGISKPTEKNDLLNQQLRKQRLAQQEELREGVQGVDYTSELATYNARLKEVQAQEARLRAEAAAAAQEKARAQAEQLRLEQERERQSLNSQYVQQQAQREAENKARLAQERAEKERAAKIKAAQEKAAQAAKLKAQLEALKTQKNTLRK